MDESSKKFLKNLFSHKKIVTKEETIIPIEFDTQEQQIISNLKQLRNQSVENIMVPNADIDAIEVTSDMDAVAQKFIDTGHKCLPVYRETLDDAIGLVNAFDVFAWRNGAANIPQELSQMVRPILFVPPYMGGLELLLEMRVNKQHMALVVDEFGGVDGLVTREDLLEEIMDKVGDENGNGSQNLFRLKGDKVELHARMDLEELEQRIGVFLSEEEREDIGTVGGLIFSLAGRIPSRGEIISHPSGVEFEIIGVDPRRLHWVRLMGEIENQAIEFNR